MAFPQVASITPTTLGSSGNSIDVDMPAAVDAGDLLLMLAVRSGTNGSFTTPTDWAVVDAVNAFSCDAAIFKKVAAGTEGGGTVTLTVNFPPDTFAVQVYRITDWEGTADGVEADGDFNVSTNAPNTPSLSPSWGSADTLWITVGGLGATCTVNTYPTNYTGGTLTDSGQEAIASAYRENATGTEDPGAFALSAFVTAAQFTVAVQPAAVVSVGTPPSLFRNRRGITQSIVRN